MKYLLFTLIAFFIGCSSLHTQWLGSPGIANPDGYYLHDGFVTNIEIGIRDDGIVVWKMREE